MPPSCDGCQRDNSCALPDLRERPPNRRSWRRMALGYGPDQRNTENCRVSLAPWRIERFAIRGPAPAAGPSPYNCAPSYSDSLTSGTRNIPGYSGARTKVRTQAGVTEHPQSGVVWRAPATPGGSCITQAFAWFCGAFCKRYCEQFGVHSFPSRAHSHAKFPSNAAA